MRYKSLVHDTLLDPLVLTTIKKLQNYTKIPLY